MFKKLEVKLGSKLWDWRHDGRFFHDLDRQLLAEASDPR
jgi:hypothetical protein